MRLVESRVAGTSEAMVGRELKDSGDTTEAAEVATGRGMT